MNLQKSTSLTAMLLLMLLWLIGGTPPVKAKMTAVVFRTCDVVVPELNLTELVRRAASVLDVRAVTNRTLQIRRVISGDKSHRSLEMSAMIDIGKEW